MKKIKRTLCVFLATCTLVSLMCFTASAKSDGAYDTQFPSFEKIQELFPELQLSENGHVLNFPVVYSNANDLTSDEWLEIHASPIAEYTAEDGSDTYLLQVYADGTFSTAGVLVSEKAAGTRSAGTSLSSTQLKVYWKEWYTDIQYSMYYYVNVGKTSSGYTTFSYTGFNYCYASVQDILPVGYTASASPGRVYITNATQNAGDRASAYSMATCYLNGMALHRMRLTVFGDKGEYTVSTSTLAPT